MPSPEVVEETLQNVALAGLVAHGILFEIRMRKMEKNIEKLQELVGDSEEVVGEGDASVEPDAQEIVSPEWEVPEGQSLPEPAPA